MEIGFGTKIRFLVFLFAWAGGLWADAPDAFRKANAAYAEGKFSDSVPLYEAARQEGLRHWALEYNLGNAYYRIGQNGKAVASYWRAFRLNTNDRDVIDNLRLVTAKAGDSAVPASGLEFFFWRVFFGLSLNTLAGLASLLFIGLCGLMGLRIFREIRLSPEAMAVLGLFWILASGWLAARTWVQARPVGIVVSAVAEVRSGPSLSYTANFTVPEGRRVLILKEQEPIPGWIEIGVPAEGLKGWVPDSAVEVL